MQIENIRDLENLFKKKGIDIKDATFRASEIILYGSRAIGVNDTESDYDFLFVGEGEPIKKNGIDLSWIKKSELNTKQWLESELAIHIAKYGRWLKGKDKWKTKVRITESTLQKKRAKINNYVESLRNKFEKLSPAFQKKYITKVRRDVQRLFLLKKNQPVPPKQVLDKEWKGNKYIRKRVLEFISKEILDSNDSKKLFDYFRNIEAT
ncbi:MAG: hypothetical protein U5K69_21430 [Balneolaceae bacterium]|nr:hypothetical protein [Balneolaceae bacterium]